jgi:hypothetical protein
MAHMSVTRIQMMMMVALGMLASVLIAQEPKPSDDPIADELSKAREAYRTSAENAGDALLDSIDKELKKVEASTRLKVDDQIKLIEQLQAEKKAFQATKLLPSSGSMKDAVRQYRTATKAAQSRCEKAFDTAAEKYRGKKDLAAAKTVLDAKQEFVLDVSPFNFDGVWVSTHSNRWSGRRTVKGEVVIDFNGTACKWERKGAQITVTWPHGGWEKLDINFKSPDQLKGKTERGLNSTWVRQK